jgi:urea carboxylase-associated protein 2
MAFVVRVFERLGEPEFAATIPLTIPGSVLHIYRSIDIICEVTIEPSTPDTSSTQGAKEHARSQAGLVVEAMATVPATSATSAPDGVSSESLTWVETAPGGGYSSRWIARGTHLRLTDVDGEACAHLVLFNADQTVERLCVADTVKVMWNAYLTAGSLLLSDQGRVLCSIVQDSSGHHDTMAGPSNRSRNERRYGAGTPESPSPAGRDLLLLAGAKLGRTERDLPASISLFQGVEVLPSGDLSFIGSAGPGCQVELVAEMDLLVLIANAAHPLDPHDDYRCGPLKIEAWLGAPTGEKDALFTETPEGHRAFLNTAEYLRARGIE